MSCRLVSFDNLSSIPQQYRSFIDTGADTFDQTIIWYEELARIVLGENDKLKLCFMEDASTDDIIAFLPMYEHYCGNPSFGITQIRALSNYYTSNFSPIISKDYCIEKSIYDLSRKLSELFRKSYYIDVNPVTSSTKVHAAIVNGFSKDHRYVKEYFRFGNWYLDLTGRNYDEYHSSLPSFLQALIKRKNTKLQKMYEVDFKIFIRPEEMERAYKDYEIVYRKSWKKPEPYSDFIFNVVKRFSKNGWCKIGVVYASHIPVAAQIWFTYKDTDSIFKLAYDPGFSKFSAGSLLTDYMIRSSFASKNVDYIDYLCGDDAFKKYWMSNRREKMGIRAYNQSSLLGFGCAAMSRIGDVFRR